MEKSIMINCHFIFKYQNIRNRGDINFKSSQIAGIPGFTSEQTAES